MTPINKDEIVSLTKKLKFDVFQVYNRFLA